MTTVLESPPCEGPTAAAPAAWIRTPRLELREFVAGDEALLVQMHSEPRLRALLVDDYPLHQPAVAGLFVERMAALYRAHPGLGIWHAQRIEREGGTVSRRSFAGWFNLMPMAERPGEVELGSRLLPQVWGSGLALEGGELLLDHAFGTLGLPRVWGICHPDNRSAQAVLATMGFSPLGIQPYDGVLAFHSQIDLNGWQAARNSPRASRLRRALRALHGGPANRDSTHDASEPSTIGPPAR